VIRSGEMLPSLGAISCVVMMTFSSAAVVGDDGNITIAGGPAPVRAYMLEHRRCSRWVSCNE
jgi:hypothetical protein